MLVQTPFAGTRTHPNLSLHASSSLAACQHIHQGGLASTCGVQTEYTFSYWPCTSPTDGHSR